MERMREKKIEERKKNESKFEGNIERRKHRSKNMNQRYIRKKGKFGKGNMKDGKVVRFEVFTAVTMKNGVFWVVTPCGSCKNPEDTILDGKVDGKM
jgi:hypothetical protein